MPSRDGGTFVALFGLLVVVAGLFGLTALVLPHVFYILLIVALFALAGAFHYCVWGWWLSSSTPTTESSKRKPGDHDDEE